MANNYSWGVDGEGRAHICKDGSNIIILSMINGNSGLIGTWILEEQDEIN